jgi:hypothetical protein
VKLEAYEAERIEDGRTVRYVADIPDAVLEDGSGS